ncbi:MAG TPA: DUF3455 domain-containing protein [Rhodopila sp.]|jgi:hypothetical protein|nr:DUF3455 domain-containing protein [Rhodopila sp.]
MTQTTRHRPILATLAACVLTTAAAAQPATVAPPQGARQVLEVQAQGVQVYTCEASANGYHWAFTAPDAWLFDATGRQVGTHFAGPTWQLQDGSKIVGAVQAQAPSPEPNAVAWLLLRVKSHAGTGLLDNAAFVRRIDTHGGAAPTTGCDATQAKTQARMRYTARYVFYAAP